MGSVEMISFVDELAKLANLGTGSDASNVAETKSSYKGTNIAGGTSRGTTPPSPLKEEAKAQNYTMVHNKPPSAAFSLTTQTSKAVPPPPVRS